MTRAIVLRELGGPDNLLVEDVELREPAAGEAAVRAGLDRHLCRCGAHPRIVRAVVRVAAESLSA